LLIDAAKAGFSEVGLNVSLEVSRAAPASVSPLYRHSPAEAVVEAVYDRSRALVDAVPHLLESHRPVRHCSVDAPVRQLHRRTDHSAISTLVKGAVRSGDVRKDIDPSDLLRALVGVSYGNPDAAGTSARRLIDILMDGLRRNGR